MRQNGVLVVLLLVLGGLSSWAVVPHQNGLPAGYCGALYAYGTARFFVTFTSNDDATLRSENTLALSPTLALAAGRLSDGSPPALSAFFEKQADLFERGIGLLRDAGVSGDQIDQLATGSFSTTSDNPLVDLAARVHVDQARLERAASRFRTTGASAVIKSVPRRLRQNLKRAASGCIASEEKVPCRKLLSSTEVAAILGYRATPSTFRVHRCVYEDHRGSELNVTVFGSTRVFTTLQGVATYEPVRGVGDEAVALAASERHGGAIDMLVRIGERTVLIDLTLADRHPSIEKLADIARIVLERLP